MTKSKKKKKEPNIFSYFLALSKYTWEEYGELDTDTSMYGLLICGFFSSLTLVGYVLVDLSRSHKE